MFVGSLNTGTASAVTDVVLTALEVVVLAVGLLSLPPHAVSVSTALTSASVAGALEDWGIIFRSLIGPTCMNASLQGRDENLVKSARPFHVSLMNISGLQFRRVYGAAFIAISSILGTRDATIDAKGGTPVTKRTKMIGVGACVLALAAGGAGVAIAGGSDEAEDAAEGPDVAISGSDLDKAEAAALEATGGGTVAGTETGDEESYYEVEVMLDDGSQRDVQLDRGFNVVGGEADEEEAGDRD